jgi:3-oxoacyl-[acyl-carrier-protein] synthase-3
MRRSVILSTGSYLPERVVLNEELTHFPESSLKLISEKTGVTSRRFAADSQCTSDLAINAASVCLEKADFPAELVEGIIVSTSSPDRIQPATATRVQHQLGAGKAFAFDINSVCSGSTFGIYLADALIKSGKCRNVLFTAAEVYSKILNRNDFSTYPYFGDGAGAILFIRSDDASEGVLHSLLRTDGSGSEVICVPGGGTMLPFDKMTDSGSAYFRMKGRAVFDFAVERGAEIIVQTIEEARIALDEIDCYICHQANVNVIRNIADKIGAPLEKFFVNLDRYGNTASASVPIALDEAISQGVISQGSMVITVAFGGGLSWGANLIRI